MKKDGLAGAFYFSGTEEKYIAERVAEQLNLLSRDGLIPDTEWNACQTPDGSCVIFASADSLEFARATGDVLKNAGVFLYYEIAGTDPATDGEPHHFVGLHLYDINRDALESCVDLESSATAFGDEPTLLEIKPPVFN